VGGAGDFTTSAKLSLPTNATKRTQNQHSSKSAMQSLPKHSRSENKTAKFGSSQHKHGARKLITAKITTLLFISAKFLHKSSIKDSISGNPVWPNQVQVQTKVHHIRYTTWHKHAQKKFERYQIQNSQSFYYFPHQGQLKNFPFHCSCLNNGLLHLTLSVSE